MKLKVAYLLIFWVVFNTSSIPVSIAQIPTITIQTNNEILDEPKVHATFIYTGIDGTIISSNIGIEIRGGFSQTYPKKTYDIEFWNDASGMETIDVQFGNLREDDDWVLDAMYNEPLRINSYLAHKLWLDMNELYYQSDEPKAKSGADVMFVEVSINNEYQGIYLLSEQVDRSLLKLKKNVDTQIRGELYKGYTWDDAVLFNEPDETPNNNSLTWSGYEYRYPTDIIDWSNVEELVDFVVNSSDEEFQDEIESRFDISNLMDYFIFLNLARMRDNSGKNIYLCRYDNDQPYFLTPWDLDGSWGLLWNGTNDNFTDDILSNRLFDRLIATDVNGYRQKISNRWFDLRVSLISQTVLQSKINTVQYFLEMNDIYVKESEAWDYEFSISDLDYMFDWLWERLEYLDNYFGNITDVAEVEDVKRINVYPNPASNYISFTESINASSAIIYNVLGEEKAIYNGSDIKENSINIENLAPGLYMIKIGPSKTRFYKF